MKVKLFTAQSEIDALIIKGSLENAGIRASIGPGERSLSLQAYSRGPNVSSDIFVEEDDLKRALEILTENKWLPDNK